MLDSEFQLCCCNRLQHILCAGFDLLATRRIVPQTWTREKERAFLRENQRIERRHRPTRAAKKHHESAWAQHVQAFFEGRFAHRVVYDVYTLVIGNLLRLRLEVALRIENYVIRASLTRQFSLLL